MGDGVCPSVGPSSLGGAVGVLWIVTVKGRCPSGPIRAEAGYREMEHYLSDGERN